ncbi:MAG: T9SS type A sorting domain-containing protein [Flavobacteriales bacterium]|nr:T9SS type A sorting domain-containing protein [Flavobacteriales bacterium]
MRSPAILLVLLPLLVHAASDATPIGFLENKGQVIDQHGTPVPYVHYILHRPGLNLQLLDHGFSYEVDTVDRQDLPPFDADAPQDLQMLRGEAVFLLHRIDVRWNGTGPSRITADGRSAEKFAFHRPHATVHEVRHFSSVIYHDISPGIDLHFHLDDDGMPKYDVVVRPGGDLASLRLRHAGMTSISLEDGALHLGTRHSTFVERIPMSWLIGGPQVDCRFVWHDDGSVGFEAPPVPPGATLVIDPWLSWGTYMGGDEWDACLGIASDDDALYIAGEARSLMGIATTGAHQVDLNGTMDAFVARFTLDGVRQWCSYLGGAGDESAQGIAVDGGRIYIGGYGSTEAGLGTPGSHQTDPAGNGDAFLAAFTTDGTLEWCTWYGGAEYDVIHGVAAAEGRVHVTGWTESPSGIATSGAHQPTKGQFEDAFIATFRQDGGLLHATYHGAASVDKGQAIAVEGHRIVTTGWTGSSTGMTTPGVHQGFFGGTLDAYLACHDTSGTLLWCSYYGGGLADRGYAVTLRNGVVHLGGATESGQYIATPGTHQAFHGGGGWDGFIARFTADGQRIWGTYYGGYDTDLVYALAHERDGVYATGSTSSVFVMGGMGVHQQHFMGGFSDAFLARFGSAGERHWGTFYGGYLGDAGRGLSERAGSVYLGGFTASTSWVSTPGGHQTAIGGNVDVMLARFASGSVGIPEPTGCTGSITLHPNPASDAILLRWHHDGPAPDRWSMIDASGALVLEGNTPGQGPFLLPIDATSLTSGLYLVRLWGDGVAHGARLMIAR